LKAIDGENFLVNKKPEYPFVKHLYCGPGEKYDFTECWIPHQWTCLARKYWKK